MGRGISPEDFAEREIADKKRFRLGDWERFRVGEMVGRVRLGDWERFGRDWERLGEIGEI